MSDITGKKITLDSQNWFINVNEALKYLTFVSDKPPLSTLGAPQVIKDMQSLAIRVNMISLVASSSFSELDKNVIEGYGETLIFLYLNTLPPSEAIGRFDYGAERIQRENILANLDTLLSFTDATLSKVYAV